jgi:hypothetical protein
MSFSLEQITITTRLTVRPEIEIPMLRLRPWPEFAVTKGSDHEAFQRCGPQCFRCAQPALRGGLRNEATPWRSVCENARPESQRKFLQEAWINTQDIRSHSSGLDHDHAGSAAIRMALGQPEVGHRRSVAGRTRQAGRACLVCASAWLLDPSWWRDAASSRRVNARSRSGSRS